MSLPFMEIFLLKKPEVDHRNQVDRFSLEIMYSFIR